MISPILGLEVQAYRTGCGEFSVYGHRGSHADYMQHTYLTVSDANRDPVTIVAAQDVYEAYGAALEQQIGVPLCLSRANGRLPYYASEVRLDIGLMSGMMLFYRGETLLAETSGWVP